MGVSPTPEAELAVVQRFQAMQTLRLKRRATTSELASILGIPQQNIESLLESLVCIGLAEEAKAGYRLTPNGRERLAEWVQHERLSINQTAVENLYASFEAFNSELKRLAFDWQQRNGVPNDHSDTSYDSAILAKLADLHKRFIPLATRVAELVERLGRYPHRFANAISKIEKGENKWFLAPIIDSYHTVWFEFHEEFIGLTGRTREAEARAGRAD